MHRYFSYNVYDECGADNRRRALESTERSSFMKNVFAKMADSTVTVETESSFRREAGYADSVNDYECGGHTAMNAYLAGNDVIADGLMFYFDIFYLR